ncbi:hypothetical protein CMUS01_09209 [Colletotrichum musicola]|uniref:Uncharacterized protein n=1 Tax=Colletotrichum musicola TaxID=2175873 RepID=A0A8H6K8G0_9PEZI|nr:hypothetical protein CMUS01_09209 [Colletotrichum musicola]
MGVVSNDLMTPRSQVRRKVAWLGGPGAPWVRKLAGKGRKDQAYSPTDNSDSRLRRVNTAGVLDARKRKTQQSPVETQSIPMTRDKGAFVSQREGLGDFGKLMDGSGGLSSTCAKLAIPVPWLWRNFA